MLTALLYLSLQIDRDSKDIMNNCFDQTTDINIFTDTNQLIITVQSLFNSECDLPSSVLVSIQLDSLVGYEPYAYAYNYNYNQTTQFIVNCTDLVKCANLKNSLSGQIFIESKSDLVIVPAGSVRISQGHTENCFYNDLTVAQIDTDLIIFKMYPTPYCTNFISVNNAGTIQLQQPLEAKVYVNYPDETMGAFENLQITMTQVLYAPDTNTPIYVTVHQNGLSEFFVSKGLKFFTFSMYFVDNGLSRIVNTYTNQYGFINEKNIYSYVEIQLKEGGFILKTLAGPDMIIENAAISVTNSYSIQMIMTTKNVSRTFEFRERVRVIVNQTYQYTEDPEPFSCSDYPGQHCDENLIKLISLPEHDVSLYMVYYQYSSDNSVFSNYSVGVNKITDSCFSGGLIDYTITNKSLNLTLYQNNASKHCVLAKDDLLAIKTTNTITKQQEQLAYINGATDINVMFQNIDLYRNPEIQVDIYRDNILEESSRIANYAIKSNSLLPQMAARIGIVSAIVFGIYIVDGLWTFVFKRQYQQYKQKKSITLKAVKTLNEEDYQ
ncbi:Conserved_hypothetical protein [Hexamita inflata]|uniref:Transmembrane protein n=1 Tax=Hexamita inflata TaxID=28002 RepID=A0AA86PSF8_9EUKA|nr:Conserved hypothetical protein [Hexamita inflata]